MMSDLKGNRFFHLLAYIGLIFVAVSLTLNAIFQDQGLLALVLKTIAEVIAYSLTAYYAFFYVRSKRNITWLIIYIVAIILVAVFIILPLFR